MARSTVCYDGATFDYVGGTISTFPGTGAVSSVFGRTGAVVAATNDYSEAQLSFTDITTNNVSTSKHGFTPKLPNDATKYLDGTGAYTVPSGTGGGIGALLFDQKLTGDTANIDTGAGGIASGYKVMVAYAIIRTDDAGALASVDFILNNDTSSIYDRELVQANSTTVSAGTDLAQARWRVSAHGSGGLSGNATMFRIEFYDYDQTDFNKIGEMIGSTPDSTAGNNLTQTYALGYRSTTAISRMKVAAVSTAKLKAGSRLTVFGW